MSTPPFCTSPNCKQKMDVQKPKSSFSFRISPTWIGWDHNFSLSFMCSANFHCMKTSAVLFFLSYHLISTEASTSFSSALQIRRDILHIFKNLEKHMDSHCSLPMLPTIPIFMLVNSTLCCFPLHRKVRLHTQNISKNHHCWGHGIDKDTQRSMFSGIED